MKPRLYKLYLITNTINGKIYVGITVQSIRKRFDQHIRDAKGGSHSHLHRAIRKYGIERFTLELLRDDAETSAELQAQEIAEIAMRQATDPSIGYNISLGGGHRASGKKIAIGTLDFPSLTAAALHYGINPATFRNRISAYRWSPEQAAEIEMSPRYYRTEIAGKTFKTLASAARAVGVNISSAQTRMNLGWTIEQALELEPRFRDKVAVTVNGTMFRSLEKAASHFGVTYNALRNRVRKGQDVNEAIKYLLSLRSRSIVVFGNTFKSQRQISNHFKIDNKRLRQHLKSGKSPEDAIFILLSAKQKMLGSVK